jgi:hypothetical protein
MKYRMTLIEEDRPGNLRSSVAILLARAIIPLWLGIGAILKILDGSPSNLPAALVKWLGGFGVDLRFVLEFTIAVELIVVGVMILVPGLARLVGILMLASFMPVLIGDVALGASSCGCFGAVQIPPWVTLVTDVFFLISLLFVARGVPALKTPRSLPTLQVVSAGLWSVLSVAVAFGLTASGMTVETPSNGPETASSGPAEGYYLPDYSSWMGQPFSQLDVAGWIRGLPDDLDEGQQYILFYRKDCEHCHELMEFFFAEELPLPTTAVAVPDRAGYPTLGVQPFVCTGCRLAELPAGVDWFLQTPVLVKLVDGVVECAAEVTADNPICLDIY